MGETKYIADIAIRVSQLESSMRTLQEMQPHVPTVKMLFERLGHLQAALAQQQAAFEDFIAATRISPPPPPPRVESIDVSPVASKSTPTPTVTTPPSKLASVVETHDVGTQTPLAQAPAGPPPPPPPVRTTTPTPTTTTATTTPRNPSPLGPRAVKTQITNPESKAPTSTIPSPNAATATAPPPPSPPPPLPQQQQQRSLQERKAAFAAQHERNQKNINPARKRADLAIQAAQRELERRRTAQQAADKQQTKYVFI